MARSTQPAGDPAIGRFLQPDSIVPDAANPQSLNRYSYVLNNPLRYTDPTGQLPCFGICDKVSDAIECVANGLDCVRDPIARTAIGPGWNGFQRGWGGFSRAASQTPGAVAATAESAWTSGPAEAVREYVADKSQDVAVTARATARDPGTFPQNAITLGISFMTVGDRMGSHNGLIAYENASGPFQWLILRGDNQAFTSGNITFARRRFDPELYWHEYRHFQQSRFMGSKYLPVYIAVNLAVFGSENLHPMERDANRYGRNNIQRPLPWSR